jgi:hypothetical protein
VKRLLGAVAASLLVSTGLGVPPATAQETAVTLRLESQSPWVVQDKRGTLDLDLLVTNGGATTLRNLSMRVVFGPRIATQTDFDQMLTSGVTSEVASDQKDLHFDIGSGATERFQMRVDMTAKSGIDQLDSQVYPTSIQLWSESTIVASVMTPTIYLVQTPERPMLATTWVQLSAPIAFDASGTLVDTGFPGAIAEGGALRAPLDAVAATTGGRHPHGVLDLVVDPLLITQARALAAGYRSSDGTTVTQDQSTEEAAKFVRVLSRATEHPETLETLAQPFGDPNLPAMVSSDPSLTDELAAEREAGTAVVDSLGDGTIQRASATVARPRDGRLSDAALEWLAAAGATIVLGNADTVDRSPYQDIFAPAPTVPTTSGVTMVLPDPATQALLDRPDLFTDPVQGAQIVLGELALIWKQAPFPTEPTRRGIALAPPPTLPPNVWSPLLSRVSDAPFLTPVTATKLVNKIDVDNFHPNGEAPLTSPDTSEFDPAYATQIAGLDNSIEALGSMLPADDQTPTDLRRRLFTATSPVYQLDPASGQPWLDSISSTTGHAFAAATPAGSDSFTFTSSEGTIPIQFGDPGPTPLSITVELRSSSITFPRDNPQSLTLERPSQVIQFDAIAQGSGESTITVLVRAPDGQPISTSSITVRSTAVNRIALLVTAGAGLGLVVLYARRWFKRRKSATT